MKIYQLTANGGECFYTIKREAERAESILLRDDEDVFLTTHENVIDLLNQMQESLEQAERELAILRGKIENGTL